MEDPSIPAKEQDPAKLAVSARRDALLREYSEVASNFRLLTDIRFKLLALLPVAAAAATALLSAGEGRDASAEVRALALSIFGLLVTVALATYNDRNDQLYDTLVGRAASIERQVGLTDGSFANRPTSWFSIRVPGIDRKWPVDHRTPVAWIYGTSTALWLYSAGAAIVQLAWGNQSAPRTALAVVLLMAAVVPLAAALRIRAQRRTRARQMRADAAEATRCLLEMDLKLAGVATVRRFVQTCQRLAGADREDIIARVRFYCSLDEAERQRFLPDYPNSLIAAHYVALVTDLPAEWIDDCARERRVRLPKGSNET